MTQKVDPEFCLWIISWLLRVTFKVPSLSNQCWLHTSTNLIFYYQEFENEKIIKQILGPGDLNGHRVSKSEESYSITMIRIKRLLVKYKKYWTKARFQNNIKAEIILSDLKVSKNVIERLSQIHLSVNNFSTNACLKLSQVSKISCNTLDRHLVVKFSRHSQNAILSTFFLSLHCCTL